MGILATARFLTVQTTIQATAEPPVWERWTIDEVDADVVRVLVSQARDPVRLQEISDSIVRPGEAEISAGVLRDRLHRASMAVELASTEAQWTDEGSMFVTAPIIEAFLREREGKPGLPTNRPLREGDVFWIILTSGPSLEPPPERGTSLAAGAVRVAEYRDRHGDVWDVTAAARQAAKLDAHRASEIAELPDDRGASLG
jgi:hypothetical protein